jgi:hypothetical protein
MTASRVRPKINCGDVAAFGIAKPIKRQVRKDDEEQPRRKQRRRHRRDDED